MPPAHALILDAQSLLFVPGSRPDRFAGALASGADVACIDLEDSVPADGKDEARTAALDAIATTGNPQLALRINAPGTKAGKQDLEAIFTATRTPQILLVPMVETAADLNEVTTVAADCGISVIALIETPRGLRHALQIASLPEVGGLMLGGADFAASLGVPMSWDALFAARGQLALAAAEAGVGLIDVPYLGLDDIEGLTAEARRVRALGFSAKAAIHPRQVIGIHAAFRPTAAEVAEATEAETAFLAAGGAAVRFKGRMLEAPIMASYRRVLARARGAASAEMSGGHNA
jgi:(S)-citramalyl-CoA lyase